MTLQYYMNHMIKRHITCYFSLAHNTNESSTSLKCVSEQSFTRFWIPLLFRHSCLPPKHFRCVFVRLFLLPFRFPQLPFCVFVCVFNLFPLCFMLFRSAFLKLPCRATAKLLSLDMKKNPATTVTNVEQPKSTVFRCTRNKWFTWL